jgi:hypothetical protein
VITVDLKDRQENVEPFIESKIRGRLYLHSEISDRGTNSMGQFFLFNHVDPHDSFDYRNKIVQRFYETPAPLKAGRNLIS